MQKLGECKAHFVWDQRDVPLFKMSTDNYLRSLIAFNESSPFLF